MVGYAFKHPLKYQPIIPDSKDKACQFGGKIYVPTHQWGHLLDPITASLAYVYLCEPVNVMHTLSLYKCLHILVVYAHVEG